MDKYTYSFPFKPHPALRKKKNLQDLTLYPLIPIFLYYKGKKTWPIEGLLDSGADKTFIPKGVADYLRLPELGEENSTGATGKTKTSLTKVGLIIGRGGRECDFGYVDAVFDKTSHDSPILIGRTPVFDEYQIIFEKYNNRLKLIPKENLPKKSIPKVIVRPKKKNASRKKRRYQKN
jgi:hypothetical protein